MFPISDEAGYITGRSLVVDAGLTVLSVAGSIQGPVQPNE